MTFEEIADEKMNGKSIDEKINYLKDMVVQLTKLLEIIIDNLPDEMSERIIHETGLLETVN